MFNWVHENIHQVGFFAAQGNSGGSVQIAFSLAYYGLEEILDLANLGGGPPPCPIYTEGILNREEQFKCLVEGELWNESREPMLFGNPLLHYPNTVVRFFLGENERSADIIETANAYHEAITSEKSLQIVPNTGHGVHRTEEGATALITSINPALQLMPVSTAELTGPAATIVSYPDENLGAAIRAALGKPPGEEIRAGELAELTYLDAGERRIADLAGIEHLSHLIELDLQENRISDISPLASLTHLTELNLFDNQISDISPLAALTNLTYLSLHTNQISDISPLESLTNLTELFLGFNEISDNSPLASLSKLNELFIPHNQISDISSLAFLLDLSEIRLFDNLIRDISALVDNAGLGEGDEIVLENNPLDMSEGSEDLENIRQLEDRGVRVIPPVSIGTRIATPTTVAGPATKTGVELVSKAACGRGQDCYLVRVACNGLVPRKAEIRAIHLIESKGAVVFTTGGLGTKFYGGHVVERMHEEGYETYEIGWMGERGWQTDSFGEGYKKVMCVYAEVVRWIAANLADNPEVMGATGQSAGSIHIGYGLTLYGLEDVFDVVVLTGGPPAADLVEQCFRPRERGGPDYIMGWLDNGDYCQLGEGPEWVIAALQAESIVSGTPGELRDYHYPNTMVAFVEGELDAANVDKGILYRDAITSETTWVVVPGAPHAVNRDPIGAARIQEMLLDGLRLVGDHAN